MPFHPSLHWQVEFSGRFGRFKPSDNPPHSGAEQSSPPNPSLHSQRPVKGLHSENCAQLKFGKLQLKHGGHFSLSNGLVSVPGLCLRPKSSNLDAAENGANSRSTLDKRIASCWVGILNYDICPIKIHVWGSAVAMSHVSKIDGWSREWQHRQHCRIATLSAIAGDDYVNSCKIYCLAERWCFLRDIAQ